MDEFWAVLRDELLAGQTVAKSAEKMEMLAVVSQAGKMVEKLV